MSSFLGGGAAEPRRAQARARQTADPEAPEGVIQSDALRSRELS